MGDTFHSSRRKIAWAKKNIAKLQSRLKAFFARNGRYEPFAEPHPEKEGFTVIKVRLKKALPNGIEESVSDILGNLRSSLDHAVYAVAVASGNPSPREAYFPFSRTAVQFESNLKGRCKDVPESLYSFFRRCKPYEGGNDALWALNTVRGTGDHAFIVPAIGIGNVQQIIVEGPGFYSAPANPVWDSAKNEMELMTIGPHAHVKSNFKLAFYIAFGEGTPLSGEPVGDILDMFVELVETILNELEAECLSLGILK